MSGPILIAAIAAFLIITWLLRSPWAKGARGEGRVRRSLRRLLDEDDYKLFSDLLLPTAEGTTQIDHVIVSRFGVFVIETKNMRGWIFGKAGQSHWTQVIFRQKSQFQNPVRQNFRHLKTIQALLRIDTHRLHSVVAFVGSAEPKTEMPPGVVWDVHSLADYIKSKRVAVFGMSELRVFEAKLGNEEFKPTWRTRSAHVRRLKDQSFYRAEASMSCPRCGADLVERTNRQTGEGFLACTRYPDCRGTRPLA